MRSGRALGDRAGLERLPRYGARVCALFVCACAFAGCIFSSERGVPLYADSEPRRARSEVALLIGPVVLVDGENVTSRGSAFELLPGCHLVEIGNEAGSVGHMTLYGGQVASVPRLVYAFRMRAGSVYTIDLEIEPTIGMAPTGVGHIVAHEQDAQGHDRVVPSIRESASIYSCKRWDAEMRASQHRDVSGGNSGNAPITRSEPSK